MVVQSLVVLATSSVCWRLFNGRLTLLHHQRRIEEQRHDGLLERLPDDAATTTAVNDRRRGAIDRRHLWTLATLDLTPTPALATTTSTNVNGISAIKWTNN